MCVMPKMICLGVCGVCLVGCELFVGVGIAFDVFCLFFFFFFLRRLGLV